MGVPETTPTPLALPASVSPAGNVPVETLQVIGSVPPLVRMFWLYAVATVPLGKLVVVMLKHRIDRDAQRLSLGLRRGGGIGGGNREVRRARRGRRCRKSSLHCSDSIRAGKLPWVTLQVIVPVPPALCSVAL